MQDEQMEVERNPQEMKGGKSVCSEKPRVYLQVLRQRSPQPVESAMQSKIRPHHGIPITDEIAQRFDEAILHTHVRLEIKHLRHA